MPSGILSSNLGSQSPYFCYQNKNIPHYYVSFFRFYRQFYLFCCYFILSLISFTLRPGPTLQDTTPTQSALNSTTSDPFSSSAAESPEVTLSLLLAKNLAEHLATTLKLSPNVTSDSLEKIALLVASNISSTLRDIWNLTAKQNVETTTNESDYVDMTNDIYNLSSMSNDTADSNNPFDFDSPGVLVLRKVEKKDEDDW